MATPSSHFHPQHLLPAILVFILAAAAEVQRPGCPKKCGDIDIPFPFGIGPGCFREGFEVLCKQTSDGPRAFVADETTNIRGEDFGAPIPPGSVEASVDISPLELVSISVATGELRAYAAVLYRCRTYDNRTFSSDQEMSLNSTPFAVSGTGNVLIGVGFFATPVLTGLTGNDASCLAYNASMGTATNGSCTTGQGCCEAPFPADVGPSKHYTLQVNGQVNDTEWKTNPCNYGMLVEKSWYNFSTPDVYGYKTLVNRTTRGVPLVLDFTAGKTSCPAEGHPLPEDYACLSKNSSCADATYILNKKIIPAYICKCWDHYDGNPYVPNGCQDIDECKLPQVYRCTSGICRNKLGGYDCPCKFGMKGDGKAGTCTPVFTPAAQATVGAIGGILLMAIISFLVILYKEKKKMKEFYKNNGGPLLEKATSIKIFKRGELKAILKNSNIIGKGGFGEVYKGLLDNKEVAIKKPINGCVRENEQFANEVIIQSQVIHKNIVRLIGCCLEVEAPLLVYEFISQGSLHDILHNNNNKVALNLGARLSIAAQSADGLAYMHSQANTRILHGDVKPANILLDENFAPKISDFGISRLLAIDKQHTASIIGDVNYMDPVYLQQGLLTEKSDVYSFGVVILELISRRKAIHSDDNSLVKCFLEAHKEQKKATEFFDKEIAIAEDFELLDSLVGMAVQCLSLDVDQRSTMMEVAEQLHKLSRSRKVQDVCH